LPPAKLFRRDSSSLLGGAGASDATFCLPSEVQTAFERLPRPMKVLAFCRGLIVWGVPERSIGTRYSGVTDAKADPSPEVNDGPSAWHAGIEDD
jgi:hypothetical protein